MQTEKIMKTKLLNSGYDMPLIGIGTFTFSPNDAERSVSLALKNGYRLVDTANAYLNEKSVGRAILYSGLKRNEVFLETKLWPTLYEDETAVDRTLQRLKTDYVDMMLLHQPAGNYISGYRLLEKGVREGKIRSIGVSNFDEEQIQEILDNCEIKPSLVQVEAHPYYPQDRLRAFLDTYGIALQAWFPLGHGDKTLINQPVFRKLADKYGKSRVQVILRWHIQKGNIIIPGTKSEQHLIDNISIRDFELTEDEMKEIAALDKNVPYVTHNREDMHKYMAWAIDPDGETE